MSTEQSKTPIVDSNLSALLRVGIKFGFSESLLHEMSREMRPLELAANALAEALRKTQWADSDCDGYDTCFFCPECSRDEKSGHAPNCSIGIALAEFEKLKI